MLAIFILTQEPSDFKAIPPVPRLRQLVELARVQTVQLLQDKVSAALAHCIDRQRTGCRQRMHRSGPRGLRSLPAQDTRKSKGPEDDPVQGRCHFQFHNMFLLVGNALGVSG